MLDDASRRPHESSTSQNPLLRRTSPEACLDLSALTEVPTMNAPMPPKLQVPTGLRVTDANGRILRSEELPRRPASAS